jgi:hypothetical protein
MPLNKGEKMGYMNRKQVQQENRRRANRIFMIYVSLAVLIVLAFVITAPAEAQRERPIPIGRYEFPQDGVVCYRTNQGTQGIALSCVNK